MVGEDQTPGDHEATEATVGELARDAEERQGPGDPAGGVAGVLAEAYVVGLLDRFRDDHGMVEQALLVAEDGLLITAVPDGDRGVRDRLAAVVAGLRSVAEGGARVLGRGCLQQVIVEMDRGYLLVAMTGHGCVLGVITGPGGDLADIGYVTALLAEYLSPWLTPDRVNQWRAHLQA